MTARSSAPPGFVRFGPVLPVSPVILAVPHAGRDYPAALLETAALPRSMLERLEDRHADLLIRHAVAAGASALVATRARCWIDLNRDEREIDPAMIDALPRDAALIASAKLRGGLGLFPRRIAQSGDIYRRPLTLADARARIEGDHRPWHAALAAMLAAARARFGTALLLDIHSMPPIAGPNAAHIVLGDRHGRSAGGMLVEQLAAIAGAEGHRIARNAPYAGGYTLDRHGCPPQGVHAVQIEIDRALYLKADLRTPGPGLAAIQALIARMATRMTRELAGPPDALAAE